MIWTEAKTAALKRLWPTHSASQIAKLIFSHTERAGLRDGGRNAVIGKAHRLKLTAKAQSPGHRVRRRT